MDPFHLPISYSFSNFVTSTSSTSSTMNFRIWSRLPQRLIDRILIFLPPPAFFRFRSVCKRWYSLIFSNAFLELYLQLSPSRHWFIFFKQKNLKGHIYRNATVSSSVASIPAVRESSYEGYLLDPDSSKWYRISFPSIPSGFSPVSTSGGLICWVSEESGSKSILLSNPLTGTFIQLPTTLRPRLCPSVGLNITNSSIDLAFAGDDLISPYAVKNLTSESFHIDGGGFYSVWGTTATLPRLCSLESGKMVHVEGRFYCMNYSPFSVLYYNISSNQWSKIQAPMRRFLRSPGLVESRGKLMLIAAVEKSKLNVPRSLRIWSLNENGGMWVEMERMPQQLYKEFAEIENGTGFGCVAHGNSVVILIRGSEKLVMFDFLSKEWSWIPPCPYVIGNGIDELHGLAYEPRLVVPIMALLEQLTLPFSSFNAA